mmetsp:Transcript_6594/g.14341  ORF Transcript_6594/g.14341 Transcript_6594/m.14341 type:complete len:155 (+) Transcript_6594:102-566(+)
MPWGPHKSALGNPNMYMPSGNGRDTIIVHSEEHRFGKNRPMTLGSNGGKLSCKPPLRIPGRGPSAPSLSRIDDMHTGLAARPTRRRTQPLFPRALSEPALRKGFVLQSQSAPRYQERERIFMQLGGPCFFSDPMPLYMYLDGSHTGTMASPAGL